MADKRTWHQREEAKKRNRQAARGGAAENTGAESDPVGNSPAAPIAMDATTASATNVPADVHRDVREAGQYHARKEGDPAPPYDGVPSRDEQEKETEKVAATAPSSTGGAGDPAHVMAASGDASKRVAHSAPGKIVTTQHGTTRQE